MPAPRLGHEEGSVRSGRWRPPYVMSAVYGWVDGDRTWAVAFSAKYAATADRSAYSPAGSRLLVANLSAFWRSPVIAGGQVADCEAVRAEYDVIVVGSRVAGATLAALLGDAGALVLLIDRTDFPSTTSSTHFFRGAGMVAVLDRLDVLSARP
jgi:hypothetical protein